MLTLTFLGVGAAFDIHAGLVRRPPRLMQRAGLAWLFRFSVEPRRLWRRYLKNMPVFVIQLIMQKLKIKRYMLET